jgi:hypothetical protein
MNLVRLTPENAQRYIGKKIQFTSRGRLHTKTIISVTPCTVRIDHPDLNNSLEYKSRKVMVIID